MKRFLALLLIAILAFSMLLTGCGPAEENSGEGGEQSSVEGNEAPETKTDNTESTQEPEETNPAKLRTNADNTLVVGMGQVKGECLPVYYSTFVDGHNVGIVFDGLLAIDESGEFVPMIAEGYEVSEDKKTYTFKMRKDVKFTNGEPVTANDVKFTYQIMADPSYDGRYITYVENIVGLEDYKSEKTPDLTGIQVIDEYTVSFTFTEARFDNIARLDMPIMPESVYAYEFNNTKALRNKMNAYEWVGSGPYKIVHFEPTQYVEYVRNDDYFLGKAKMEKLIYKMTTVDTQMAEIEKGEIDILLNVAPSPENYGILDRLDFALPHTFPGNTYGYMGFNMRDDILKDKRVRQALVYGFDRDVFLKKYYDGHSVTLNVPFSLVSYALTDSLKSKIKDYSYDKEKAIELLEAAGWKVGDDGFRYKDGKKLELKWLTYTDSKYVETLTPMLLAYWNQIGVELIVEQMEFNTLVDKVYVERDFQLYNMAWVLTNLPTSNYTTFHSNFDIPDGNNSIGFRNKKNDELLVAATKEFDKDKQIQIFEEWGILFNEEVPYMLINNNEELEIVNARVKGYATSPFVHIDDILKDVSVD